jgi:hypothetical protein
MVFKYQMDSIKWGKLRERSGLKEQFWDIKIEIISGYFNQIGINDKYHDCKWNRLTIDCTINDTQELKNIF